MHFYNGHRAITVVCTLAPACCNTYKKTGAGDAIKLASKHLSAKNTRLTELSSQVRIHVIDPRKLGQTVVSAGSAKDPTVLDRVPDGTLRMLAEL